MASAGYWAQLTPGQTAVWASIGNDGTIWIVNKHNEIYKLIVGRGWERIPGACKQIYVSDAKNIACVNGEGQTFVWETNVNVNSG